MNIFVAIIGLAFLILIHEAGHFFVARAVGMKPRKFYLGFPPPLVRVVRNGIDRETPHRRTDEHHALGLKGSRNACLHIGAERESRQHRRLRRHLGELLPRECKCGERIVGLANSLVEATFAAAHSAEVEAHCNVA